MLLVTGLASSDQAGTLFEGRMRHSPLAGVSCPAEIGPSTSISHNGASISNSCDCPLPPATTWHAALTEAGLLAPPPLPRVAPLADGAALPLLAMGKGPGGGGLAAVLAMRYITIASKHGLVGVVRRQRRNSDGVRSSSAAALAAAETKTVAGNPPAAPLNVPNADGKSRSLGPANAEVLATRVVRVKRSSGRGGSATAPAKRRLGGRRGSRQQIAPRVPLPAIAEDYSGSGGATSSDDAAEPTAAVGGGHGVVPEASVEPQAWWQSLAGAACAAPAGMARLARHAVAAVAVTGWRHTESELRTTSEQGALPCTLGQPDEKHESCSACASCEGPAAAACAGDGAAHALRNGKSWAPVPATGAAASGVRDAALGARAVAAAAQACTLADESWSSGGDADCSAKAPAGAAGAGGVPVRPASSLSQLVSRGSGVLAPLWAAPWAMWFGQPVYEAGFPVWQASLWRLTDVSTGMLLLVQALLCGPKLLLLTASMAAMYMYLLWAVAVAARSCKQPSTGHQAKGGTCSSRGSSSSAGSGRAGGRTAIARGDEQWRHAVVERTALLSSVLHSLMRVRAVSMGSAGTAAAVVAGGFDTIAMVRRLRINGVPGMLLIPLLHPLPWARTLVVLGVMLAQHLLLLPAILMLMDAQVRLLRAAEVASVAVATVMLQAMRVWKAEASQRAAFLAVDQGSGTDPCHVPSGAPTLMRAVRRFPGYSTLERLFTAHPEASQPPDCALRVGSPVQTFQAENPG